MAHQHSKAILCHELKVENIIQASQCSTSYVSCQRDTSSFHLLVLLGARWPPLSTDTSSWDGAQQQTRSSGVRMLEQADRQTDRMTDARQLHRPCSAMQALPITISNVS